MVEATCVTISIMEQVGLRQVAGMLVCIAPHDRILSSIVGAEYLPKVLFKNK